MTKKEFIWLGIRFAGLFKLILSVGTIATAIGTIVLLSTMIFPSDTAEGVVFVTLLSILLDAVVDILIVVYLLWFGKIVFNIIHRTSGHSSEAVLEKQDYTELLIRFIGFWWLWRVVFGIFGLISGWLMISVVSYLEYLPSEGSSDGIGVLLSKLSELHHQFARHAPLYIVVYALLAWYFLKRGQIFINWLNHLWLKAIRNNLTRNPVTSV